ncbi:hypothetical protein CC80DRAFT_165115 [Byssothecium circinans]|uniref:Uncharacterized protein n=1 Tax=Byssothecium circinans TaxID=147558 RepID=A0A6A5TLH4_9PLEO|nr:hypothetical protein CC80DRAFT_165115 [Byssothecium circinans]
MGIGLTWRGACWAPGGDLRELLRNLERGLSGLGNIGLFCSFVPYLVSCDGGLCGLFTCMMQQPRAETYIEDKSGRCAANGEGTINNTSFPTVALENFVQLTISGYVVLRIVKKHICASFLAHANKHLDACLTLAMQIMSACSG